MDGCHEPGLEVSRGGYSVRETGMRPEGLLASVPPCPHLLVDVQPADVDVSDGVASIDDVIVIYLFYHVMFLLIGLLFSVITTHSGQ